MQSFDINLLAPALAPASSSSVEGTGGDVFANAFDRELARADAKHATRDATDDDHYFEDSLRDTDRQDNAPSDDPDENYSFPDYSPYLDDNGETRPDTDATAGTSESAVTKVDAGLDDSDETGATSPGTISGASDKADTVPATTATTAATASAPASGSALTQQSTVPGILANANAAALPNLPILPIGDAGVVGAASVVQPVVPNGVQPAVVALATNPATTPAVAPPVTPASVPTPTASGSAAAPQAPVSPVVPGDDGLGLGAGTTGGDTSGTGSGTGNLGKGLATPIPTDDGESIFQTFARPSPGATVASAANGTNATTGTTTTTATSNAAQTASTVDIATLVAPATAPPAPETASMAQTMIAAQLARSGGEAMAANSGAASIDVIPPVNGVPTVAQPGSATAVMQTAATHRPTGHPPPADQVAVQIQRAVASGETRITVRLHPAELGRVDVDLEIGKDGRVLAIVTAEKADTLEMLQRDTRVLERALQDAGLDTDSDSLSFNLFGEKEAGDTDQASLTDRSDDGDGSIEAASDEEAAPIQIVSDRALDIRV